MPSGVALCARVPAQIPDQSSSVSKPEQCWRRARQHERPSRSSLELTDTHTHISWELVSKSSVAIMCTKIQHGFSSNKPACLEGNTLLIGNHKISTSSEANHTC